MANGIYFHDRNARIFVILLHYLREGRAAVADGFTVDSLLSEAAHYGLAVLEHEYAVFRDVYGDEDRFVVRVSRLGFGFVVRSPFRRGNNILLYLANFTLFGKCC